MSTDDAKTCTTVGKTLFVQGQGQPLFCIAPGIPCDYARERAAELMGCVRDMTLAGAIDGDPQLIWASHYLSALAKALLDDVELAMKH